MGVDFEAGSTARRLFIINGRDISSGAWFSLNDGANFHFDATLDAAFKGTDTNVVQLTPFRWKWWMAVGEHQDLQASAGAGYVDLEWDCARH